MSRGARIGALAGIALAVLYIALGTRVNEFTELLGYSLVIVGSRFCSPLYLSFRGWDSGAV
jgi:hypothetical protein